MRITVELSKRHVDALADISQAEGVSRAALIREAIEDLIAQRRNQRSVNSAFGLWKGRVPFEDGLAMHKHLRD